MRIKDGKTLEFWPLILALLLYGSILYSQTQKAMAQTGGTFIYALDDPYIHMAMAKNLVRHGVWGVTPYEFTASSSSPLWTVLLALSFVIFGCHHLIPYILNVIFGALFIVIVHFFMKKNKAWGIPLFLLQYFLIRSIPLPALVLFGMEHTLQIVIDFLFIYHLSRRLTSEQPPRRFDLATLTLYSALCLTVRYEGLFIASLGLALLLYRRQFRAAAAVLAGALPLALLGLLQVAKGWMFLPNSVLLKGPLPSVSMGLKPFLKAFWDKIELGWTPAYWGLEYLTVLFVWLALALLFNWAMLKSIFHDWRQMFGIMVLLIIILHVKFAALVYYFRYDAYLAALGLCALGLNLQLAWPFIKERLVPSGKTVRVAVAYLFLAVLAWYFSKPFDQREHLAEIWIPHYCRDIYRQQVQVAQFLKSYYPQETVVVNDIGAINYYGDIRIVDLWGLASIESARAQRSHTFNTNFIRALSHRRSAKIAVLHKDLFASAGGLPSEWIEVGQLTISDNSICWSETVNFYAIDPAYRERLAADLSEFKTRLPSGCEILL